MKIVSNHKALIFTIRKRGQEPFHTQEISVSDFKAIQELMVRREARKAKQREAKYRQRDRKILQEFVGNSTTV